jgi:undecaprenyl diphosphate synthase
MKQSTLLQSQKSSLHVAIIMDGNGRWAKARGLPRIAGHRVGGDAVRRVVEAAPRLGISTLTLYAFSSDNWQRPASEVASLMQMLHSYLQKETRNCAKHGVRISVIGRRDRLAIPLRRAIEKAEAATIDCRALHLRLAVDYSARDAILCAARQLGCLRNASREEFSRALGAAYNSSEPALEVDLLIRTGGEQRLSDFLLWESAYAELVFTKRMWPEFDASDLEAAIKEFHSRQRRFGRVSEAEAV